MVSTERISHHSCGTPAILYRVLILRCLSTWGCFLQWHAVIFNCLQLACYYVTQNTIPINNCFIVSLLSWLWEQS